MELECRIMDLEEILNHLAAITGHHYQFVNPISHQCIYGALQERALSHLQETLGTMVGKRAQA